MERFVFVAAIVVASIFALGAVFGGSDFNFEFGDEGGTAPIVAVAAGRMDPQTFAGDELRLKHLAANVTVVTEERTDYQIEIDNSAGRAPMPLVSVDNGHVIVDGQLRGRIGNCNQGGAELRGYSIVSTADLPRVTIHAPRSLHVERGGAGATEIGATQTLSYDHTGCSSTTIADVVGELDIDLAGSGEVHAGAARGLNADVAGSGALTVGAVTGDADIDIAGSGTVTIASLTGDLTSDGVGSGSLTVSGGQVGSANIDRAGSGDVSIAAPVRALDVSITGSSDVEVTGVVGEIDAEIAGSGSVSATSVTGGVRRQIMGSGEVRVGNETAKNEP